MRRGLYWGEGRLIAVALLCLLALTLCLWLGRQPRTVSAAPVHSASLETLERAGRIDINAAPADVLKELPGIGPALAEAIVAYREEHGPFADVEQLDDVPGIGPAKLEAVRALVRLD